MGRSQGYGKFGERVQNVPVDDRLYIVQPASRSVLSLGLNDSVAAHAMLAV